MIPPGGAGPAAGRFLSPGTAHLLRALRDRGPEVVRVLAWILAAGAAEAAALAVLVPLLSLAGVETGGTLEPLARRVRGALGAAGVPGTLPAGLAVLVAASVLSALVIRVRDVRAGVLQLRLVADLRKRLYHSLSAMDWIAFVRLPGARLSRVLEEEVENAGEAVEVLLGLAAEGVLVAVWLGLFLAVSPGMALATAGIGIAVAAGFGPWVRRARRRGERSRAAGEALHGTLLDQIAGSKLLRGHGLAEEGRRRFSGAADRAADGSEGILRALADARWILSVATVVTLALFVYLALGVAALGAGSLLLLLFLLRRVLPALVEWNRSRQYLASLEPSLDEVAALQAAADAEVRPAGARDEPVEFRRAVRLEGVGFSYGGAAGERVLRGVDLEIPAGRTIALVGPSGAGKTTVADVALGILAPDEGTVLVDGVPLAPETRASWGSRVGFVSEAPFLFGESIRANLLWARPGAGEVAMRRALEAADAAEVIDRLPGGLDAPLGDRGVLLSAGERQRLALACALLREPSLLVLDNATSDLDPAAEFRVMAAVERLRGKVAVLLVTHRLGSVRNADRVVVLERGRVAESGTWDALMAAPRSRFRALALAQGYERLLLREEPGPEAPRAEAAPAAASRAPGPEARPGDAGALGPGPLPRPGGA